MNSNNKVLFFGDSGVGKSTLINTLSGNSNSRPQSTIGCAIQILTHKYAVGTPKEDLEFIELFDIGGWNSHRNAVSVYFENVSGVIYVHDLTNSKSEENLSYWADLFNNYRVIQNSQCINRLSTEYNNPFCNIEKAKFIPTLIIGSCLDLASHRVRNTNTRSNISGIKDYECIFLDCRKDIPAGSTNMLTFSKFLDAVVEKSRATNDRSLSQPRRRRLN